MHRSHSNCLIEDALCSTAPVPFDVCTASRNERGERTRLIRTNREPTKITQLIPPSSRTTIIIDFQMMRTCALVLSFVRAGAPADCVLCACASRRSVIRHGDRRRPVGRA